MVVLDLVHLYTNLFRQTPNALHRLSTHDLDQLLMAKCQHSETRAVRLMLDLHEVNGLLYFHFLDVDDLHDIDM